MAEKKKQEKIRETWENLFNFLKLQAPVLFGTKVWADVSFIGQDPEDTSKIIIEFNEEAP